MDTVLAALIRSRSKSIATLTSDCAGLRERVKQARVAAAASALQAQLDVKAKRLDRLLAELKGLQAEADAQAGQLQVPGTEVPPPPPAADAGAVAVAPVVRKPR